ncbi:MAG: hypothetical protein WC148_03510 [Bacilli bacterium]
MSKYYTPPATVVDGDIAYAADVNSINTETDTGFTLAYADISAMEGTVSAWAALAKKWAENPEDVEVTSGAYSAMHWALKSESFVSDAQAYSVDSQNYSIAAAASASTATTKATSATTSATTATTKATAAATSATSAATSATASEASAVRAESAAVDNASSITALTAVVSTNTGNISDNTFDISLHETRILANASDIASHDTRILANTSSISDLETATHITNFLINGNFTVNQRGFDGVWSTVAIRKYGYDRWCKFSNTHIEQVIAQENIPSGTYTLSWIDGGSGLSGSIGGTTVLNGGSASITVTGNVSVTVPNDATKVQLEKGTVAHSLSYVPYEETLDRCMYYLQYKKCNARMYATIALAIMNTTVDYKQMYAAPTATLISAGSVVNVSDTRLRNVEKSSARFEIGAAAAGDTYIFGSEYQLDAELEGTGSLT